MGTIRGLGGGRLGRELTLVYERLGGRRATGTWLMAPATPTMQSVFRQHAFQPEEILPLLAFMEEAAGQRQPAGSASLLHFFLIGFGGMLPGLVVLQAA